MASIGDAPYSAVTVLGYEQRPIVRNGYTHRPAPDAAVIHHKTGEKVVIFAGWNAVIKAHTHDLVAGAPKWLNPR